MAERLAGQGLAVNADASGEYVPGEVQAGMASRCLSYAVDSVVLFGFCMVFSTAAFLVIFIGTDTGRSNITEGQEWAFLGFLMATFPVWYAFNVGLVSTRGFTVGQYVIGLRTESASGRKLTPGRVAAYWLALHPLLFHPLLALSWGLFGVLGVTLAGSELVFTLGVAMVLLCLVMPFVNLIYMAIDPHRKGIHDRLAGVRIVRL